MSPQRLSALDASFLAVESPSAHMHVGWAATFAAPEHGPRPGFGELFAHIAGRLGRAPRYRQRLAPDALGLHAPLWVDAEDFDPAEHIHHSAAERLEDLADAVLSEPLRRDRPLWEFWIAPELADGRIGARRQGPSLHGRRPRRGRARHAAARLRAGALAGRGGRVAAGARAARARAAGARRVRPCARAARAAEARRSSWRARRSRCRVSRSGPAARWPAPCSRSPRRACSTPRARPTATSPPRGARSTSCARSRTTTA